MLKKIIPALIFLVIVIIAWIAVSAHSVMITTDVNPNAEQYITPIAGTFDTTGFDRLQERMDDSLRIKPEEFEFIFE